MPTGYKSYFSGDRFSSTADADCKDTSYSAECPRIKLRFFVSFFSFLSQCCKKSRTRLYLTRILYQEQACYFFGYSKGFFPFFLRILLRFCYEIGSVTVNSTVSFSLLAEMVPPCSSVISFAIASLSLRRRFWSFGRCPNGRTAQKCATAFRVEWYFRSSESGLAEIRFQEVGDFFFIVYHQNVFVHISRLPFGCFLRFS